MSTSTVIDTPAARAKLATLPDGPWRIIRDMAHRVSQARGTHATAHRALELGEQDPDYLPVVLSMKARLDILNAALNAAIVAAFEPNSAPDQNADVARILARG